MEGRRCWPGWLLLQEATSAFAIHLARVGRLAWASTQFVMSTNDSIFDKVHPYHTLRKRLDTSDMTGMVYYLSQQQLP
jgi:hypothetical protein